MRSLAHRPPSRQVAHSAQFAQRARAPSIQSREGDGIACSHETTDQHATRWPRDFSRVSVRSRHASDAHEIALSGLQGHPAPFPHLATIQRAFEPHDLTGIDAHVGGAATEANQRLGAAAYATGRSVAFRQPPSLHTAAHEAAHVIQQRSGVTLPGGIGRSGDGYEQHANAVANSVVAGRSAAFLLNRYTGTDAARSDQLQFQGNDSSRFDAEGQRSETYKPAQPGQPPPSGGGPGTGMNNVGSCKLLNGTMKWSMVPRVGSVNVRIEFIPNPAVAAASKTISFIQTVTEITTIPGEWQVPRWGALSPRRFDARQIGTTNVDASPTSTERDPFFGAKWNAAGGKWTDEPEAAQARPGDYKEATEPREGSRPFNESSKSAVINDSPMIPVNQSKEFETVATVLETGQSLGTLRWGIQRWPAGLFSQGSSTIVRRADCAEGQSSGFSSAVKEFYGNSGRFVLDGFAPGSSDLPGSHQQRLAPILARLRGEPTSRVIVGGAATADEADPAILSRGRAEKVRTYLVGEGIVSSRIDVEAYGSDWAKSPTTDSASAPLNRRVQIKVVT